MPIAAYKKLYEIEATIRGLASDETLAVRRAESKAVFDEIVSWAEAYKAHEPPASGLGAAIRYMTDHKVALGRFLEDGVIPIDNGIVERLHVRAALTRGERAEIAYTILGCCRLADVNPVEYLTDVLPRLARGLRLREVPAMLPAAWKAARQAAAPAADPAAAPVS